MNAKIGTAVFAAVVAMVSPSNAKLALSPSAPGYFVNIELLLGVCTESDAIDLCDSYIKGVIDSIISNRGIFENNRICLRQETGVEQFRSMVVKFIRQHPDLPKDTIAASAVVTAITEEFPCSEGDPIP